MRDRAIREVEPRFGAAEAGLALLEVVIASVVLLVILIPVASLLSSNVALVGNAQWRSQAQTLAVATANQVVSGALNGTFPPVGLGGSWSSATPTTVDDRMFYVFEAGGWCVAGTTSSNQFANGTVSSSNQPSYFVVTKVQWGPGASTSGGSTNKVVTDGAASVALSYVPLPGTVLSACPVGLS